MKLKHPFVISILLTAVILICINRITIQRDPYKFFRIDIYTSNIPYDTGIKPTKWLENQEFYTKEGLLWKRIRFKQDDPKTFKRTLYTYTRFGKPKTETQVIFRKNKKEFVHQKKWTYNAKRQLIHFRSNCPSNSYSIFYTYGTHTMTGTFIPDKSSELLNYSKSKFSYLENDSIQSIVCTPKNGYSDSTYYRYEPNKKTVYTYSFNGKYRLDRYTEFIYKNGHVINKKEYSKEWNDEDGNLTLAAETEFVYQDNRLIHIKDLYSRSIGFCGTGGGKTNYSYVYH